EARVVPAGCRGSERCSGDWREGVRSDLHGQRHAPGVAGIDRTLPGGGGTPAISIVMPCHHRGDVLPRALDAYDRQDGDAPFEIIAVDDASSDGTAAVLSDHVSAR